MTKTRTALASKDALKLLDRLDLPIWLWSSKEAKLRWANAAAHAHGPVAIDPGAEKVVPKGRRSKSDPIKSKVWKLRLADGKSVLCAAGSSDGENRQVAKLAMANKRLKKRLSELSANKSRFDDMLDAGSS